MFWYAWKKRRSFKPIGVQKGDEPIKGIKHWTLTIDGEPTGSMGLVIRCDTGAIRLEHCCFKDGRASAIDIPYDMIPSLMEGFGNAMMALQNEDSKQDQHKYIPW